VSEKGPTSSPAGEWPCSSSCTPQPLCSAEKACRRMRAGAHMAQRRHICWHCGSWHGRPMCSKVHDGSTHLQTVSAWKLVPQRSALIGAPASGKSGRAGCAHFEARQLRLCQWPLLQHCGLQAVSRSGAHEVRPWWHSVPRGARRWQLACESSTGVCLAYACCTGCWLVSRRGEAASGLVQHHCIARLWLCACCSRASHVTESHLGVRLGLSAVWALSAAKPSAASAWFQAAHGTVALVRRVCVLGLDGYGHCRQDHACQCHAMPGLDQQREGRCRGPRGPQSLCTCRRPAHARLHSLRGPSRCECTAPMTCEFVIDPTSASLSLRLNREPFGKATWACHGMC
jgi:hypothetical protein